ncbi:FkbM family methyltransferase [Segetibacter sp. 3557_3]|uniref:FkbM family methyltransferase n=1 Tax=Segetibacter sp. 3557_3 TaxID=2547429 RepID=UPI001058D575|nr:FkbM family methyltransferase [Segetibacter sp. 3557_3]TDH26434.1 FkbM family methyltransferase [Segetibacter sp. 3557_3]
MSVIVKVLGKARNILDESIKRIQHSSDPQFRALQRWYNEDLHNLKRSSFEGITEQSIVFDLGGYEGQWSSDVYARYNCSLFIFEPVMDYYNLIKGRFAQNDKMQVFQFGLASKTYEASISIDQFASSIHNESLSAKPTETIQMKAFDAFVRQHNIGVIDLMKINIEGGEYDLLEQLIADGHIQRVKQLLIQFHNFVPDAKTKMEKIKAGLAKTHNPMYMYEFVWEHWKLNSP